MVSGQARLPRGAACANWGPIDRELEMTVYASGLLTPEEFASLLEIAITSPSAKVPAHHMAKLISMGYVVATANGALVTGDGLMRITESE
jgi:hypothetical protein